MEKKIGKLYIDAGSMLKRVMQDGASVKSVVYASSFVGPKVKSLIVLLGRAVRNAAVLDEILENSKFAKEQSWLDPWVAKIILAEFLLDMSGHGSKLKKEPEIFTKYKSELIKALKNKKGQVIAAPAVGLTSKDSGFVKPRYVMINTILSTKANVIAWFKKESWEFIPRTSCNANFATYTATANALQPRQFMEDFHVPNLLVFSPSSRDFHTCPLLRDGSIILMDKASCLASMLLNPTPGSKVIDACAAPGMKTVHLACLMQNKGHIAAVELNVNRAETLQNIVENHGATCVEVIRDDFRGFNKNGFYKDAEYILVDPSCSGSGIVDRPLNQRDLDAGANKERLQKLKNVQASLLRRALTFPHAKRVVYSTCSLNEEENEAVIEDTWKAATEHGFRVVPALDGSWNHRGSKKFEFGPNCIYALPDIDKCNGFFVAVYERDQLIQPGFAAAEEMMEKARLESKSGIALGKRGSACTDDVAAKKIKKEKHRGSSTSSQQMPGGGRREDIKETQVPPEVKSEVASKKSKNKSKKSSTSPQKSGIGIDGVLEHSVGGKQSGGEVMSTTIAESDQEKETGGASCTPGGKNKKRRNRKKSFKSEELKRISTASTDGEEPAVAQLEKGPVAEKKKESPGISTPKKNDHKKQKLGSAETPSTLGNKKGKSDVSTDGAGTPAKAAATPAKVGKGKSGSQSGSGKLDISLAGSNQGTPNETTSAKKRRRSKKKLQALRDADTPLSSPISIGNIKKGGLNATVIEKSKKVKKFDTAKKKFNKSL